MFSQTLYKNLHAQVQAIRSLLDSQLVLPAICLLYASIDIVASLERRHESEGTRVAFERWCNEYLLRQGDFQCSATDLFAARCGILHNASSEADLVRSGKARPLAYAWGGANRDLLQEAGRRLGRPEVAVHVEDLFKAFTDGMVCYLEDVATDPERVEMVERASGIWLTDMSSRLLSAFFVASEERTPEG